METSFENMELKRVHIFSAAVSSSFMSMSSSYIQSWPSVSGLGLSRVRFSNEQYQDSGGKCLICFILATREDAPLHCVFQIQFHKEAGMSPLGALQLLSTHTQQLFRLEVYDLCVCVSLPGEHWLIYAAEHKLSCLISLGWSLKIQQDSQASLTCRTPVSRYSQLITICFRLCTRQQWLRLLRMWVI